MNSAIYIGPGVDVGKILLLPQIKEWIMIEELPSLAHAGNSDKRFDSFFLKLKKVFGLIGFICCSEENHLIWFFHNKTSETSVWYYHSTEFPNVPEATLPNLKYFCSSVDTVVHSGALENKYILKLCPNLKYYITSGDQADACADTDELQYALEFECKCPFGCKECQKLGMGIKMYYLPDFECSNLLFWNVLWNRDTSEYQDELFAIIEQTKQAGLTEITTSLKEFYCNVVTPKRAGNMKLLFEFQAKFKEIAVDNTSF